MGPSTCSFRGRRATLERHRSVALDWTAPSKLTTSLWCLARRTCLHHIQEQLKPRSRAINQYLQQPTGTRLPVSGCAAPTVGNPLENYTLLLRTAHTHSNQISCSIENPNRKVTADASHRLLAGRLQPVGGQRQRPRLYSTMSQHMM